MPLFSLFYLILTRESNGEEKIGTNERNQSLGSHFIVSQTVTIDRLTTLSNKYNVRQVRQVIDLAFALALNAV